MNEKDDINLTALICTALVCITAMMIAMLF